MKKTLSILLALALVLSMGVMTAFAVTSDGKLDLTADKASAKVGDVVTFTVTATPDSALGVGALDFKVNYDATAYELVSVTPTDYIPSPEVFSGNPGVIGYGAATGGAATTTGTVMTFQLKVLKTNGTVTLNIGCYGLGDRDGTDVTDAVIANSRTSVTVACAHTYGDWTVTTPATCTTPGEETRTCTACGETETREIPVIAHTAGNWEVQTPATCTEPGVEVLKCTVCGAEMDSRAIPATGHTVDAWVVDDEPGCQTVGHRHGVCTACGETVTEEIPALGHEIADDAWVVDKEATCTEPGERHATCTRCEETVVEVIAPLGHDFGEWVVTKEPTETEEGSKERVCSRCGEKEVVAIDKLTVSTDTSVPNIPKTGTAVAGSIAAIAMLSMAAGVAAVTMKKKHEDD